MSRSSKIPGCVGIGTKLSPRPFRVNYEFHASILFQQAIDKLTAYLSEVRLLPAGVYGAEVFTLLIRRCDANIITNHIDVRILQ